jgi:hypothetical protein
MSLCHDISFVSHQASHQINQAQQNVAGRSIKIKIKESGALEMYHFGYALLVRRM